MPLKVQCSKCRKSYQVQDKLLGKAVKCRCGATIRIPAAATAGGPQNDLTEWLDEELSALEEQQKREAERAALQAEEEAQRPSHVKNAEKTFTPPKKRQTLKQAIIRAVITTVTVIILGVAGYVAGDRYIKTHPMEGTAVEVRTQRLAQGIGGVVALGVALPWLIFALKFRKLER